MSAFKEAFTYPSMVTRLSIGESFGFLCGLLTVLVIFIIAPDINLPFLLGIVFWYTMLGVFVGLLGVFRKYLFIPMPWWFRGSWVGLWLNLGLALLIWDVAEDALAARGIGLSFGTYILGSIVEGAILGLVLDFLATKFGGEGKETIKD